MHINASNDYMGKKKERKKCFAWSSMRIMKKNTTPLGVWCCFLEDLCLDG